MRLFCTFFIIVACLFWVGGYSESFTGGSSTEMGDVFWLAGLCSAFIAASMLGWMLSGYKGGEV